MGRTFQVGLEPRYRATEEEAKKDLAERICARNDATLTPRWGYAHFC